MKTLSQNTTSSACAPETDLQQLVATPVPDERRISFWPQHFGLIPQWVTLEPRTRSQLINSIDILRARRATGLMTRDNYRTVNNITLGKYPEAK